MENLYDLKEVIVTKTVVGVISSIALTEDGVVYTVGDVNLSRSWPIKQEDIIGVLPYQKSKCQR